MQIKIFKDLKQYTLTSTLKKEDIELVKKYRPLALKKKDADGNDVFAMSYVSGRPCVSASGVTFGSESSDEGYAQIIGEIPDGVTGDKVGEYIADKVGSALACINEFETSVPEVVAAIKDERKTLIDSIAEV